jgi:hypothetical protein
LFSKGRNSQKGINLSLKREGARRGTPKQPKVLGEEPPEKSRNEKNRNVVRKIFPKENLREEFSIQ